MATDTTDKVQTTSSDVTDVDFNEVAANLGFSLKTAEPAKTETKPTDATTEPDETAETEDPKPETGETPETGEADPATDSEETADDEAGEGSDEEKADDGDLKPESEDQEPTKIQKRIDKLTAEKHELREQLDALKAERDAAKAAAEAQPPVIFKDPENPLSSFTDAAALEAEIAKAQAVLDWADDNREGGTVTVAGEEKYYDADAVKQIRANARSIVKAAPKQQEYLRIREATLPEAKAAYPGFFTPGTAEHQALQAALRQYPSIAQFPNMELIIGDAFAGQQLRLARLQQQQKKRAAAEPTKKAPAKTDDKVPKAPSPNASPKVSASSSASLRQKAGAALKARGDADALSAFMESIV